MALFLIALIFVGFGIFCRRRAARWLMWGGATVFCIGGLGLIWPEMYYRAHACRDVAGSGLECPENPALLGLAMAHQIAAQVIVAAGVFAAPMISLIALWLERRHRGDPKNV